MTFEKQNDKYLMKIEKVQNSNNIEYWLEFTNKKTLMTQTLISKIKRLLILKIMT